MTFIQDSLQEKSSQKKSKKNYIIKLCFLVTFYPKKDIYINK